MARRPLRRNAAASQPSRAEPAVCELCRRQVERFTLHHLVPKARGGNFGPTVRLCPTCHRQIHALFAETTLAQELNSLERLRANEEINRYLAWAQKQKGGNAFQVRRARERR